MKAMQYKGYTTLVEFDADDRILVGRILGIRDVISFHGTSVDEFEQAFHESVDDYVAYCEEHGKSPNKPYSGKIFLRVSPELHSAVAFAAAVKGTSVNKWVTGLLESAAREMEKTG